MLRLVLYAGTGACGHRPAPGKTAPIVAARAHGFARRAQISDESATHAVQRTIWKIRIARRDGCGTMKLWCDGARAS
ncbi:hypothetical protein BCCH1_19670 [Burkholderia contaminans]|uniref:Uncharacterized protein n=1 Tax=Burkholderia contaminans TaxID=488447 RepID=A0A250L4Q4_9BURK|nr:hypothetical protein BCCH1_19670 [Burkholderia contaminans]